MEYERYMNEIYKERANKKSEFALANALWVQMGCSLLDTYTYVIDTHYKGGLHDVDFGKAEETMGKINSWVDTNTRGKISKIIDRITPDSKLIITNAIYFKDNWKKTFDEEKTKEEPFYITKEEKVLVDMMTEKQNYEFRNYPSYQILKLIYP